MARLGQIGGGQVFHLDARHRRVALKNLTLCFGHEKSPAEISIIARENFRRIGENYVCAIKTAGMSFEVLKPHKLNAPINISASPVASWINDTEGV